jgi:phosphoribosylanthranilate isomerase
MINGLQLKVCGITRAEDIRAATEVGADFLGFNLYPQSPRYLPLAHYGKLVSDLRMEPRSVAILVEPSREELTAAGAAGFDFFQIHFAHTTPFETLQSWSRQVGAHRLWLAPQLPPAIDVPAEWLPLAGTFLLDTFHAGGFGGSGKTGDWTKFARHQSASPQHTWALAGGLGPDNVVEAIARSGTRFIDVNSGVESSPGVKDAGKLRTLAAVLAALK